MNKSAMIEVLQPTAQELRAFAKACNNVADLLDRTTTRDVDGSNLSSMTAIRTMLDHPWMATSKARPILNATYKALWENAKSNADAALAAARAHLEAFAPPKRGRKKIDKIDDASTTQDALSAEFEDESTDIDATKIGGI